ncbi:MAG: hypothetical protein WC873_04065, partial [Candidatus Gracilibacteria bacterium]
IEYIKEDEYVEITPKSIRLRKAMLTDNDRRRARRGGVDFYCGVFMLASLCGGNSHKRCDKVC